MDYLSSPIKWCESRESMYHYSNNIVEFENAMSSLLFIIFAAYGSYIHNGYISNTGWIFMALIGITSCWFHATLSQIGQLADELSIVAMSCYLVSIIVFEYTPINRTYGIVRGILLSVHVWLSGSTMFICVYYPKYSPIIMIVEGIIIMIPTVSYMTVSVTRKRIFMQAFKSAFVGVIFWCLDIPCYFNAHMYWHIFISYSTYMLVLGSSRINRQTMLINIPSDIIICTDALIPYWSLKQYQPYVEPPHIDL